MGVRVLCEALPVSAPRVGQLWERVVQARGADDADIAVQCVSQKRIQELNRTYRNKNKPTNVLTFTYPKEDHHANINPEHDIVVCLDIAQSEAQDRGVDAETYTALLLIHAMLHATGLDHETSADAAHTCQLLEQQILTETGYDALSL